MIKLVLVRHGESEWNKKNLFTGWMDVDLSEKGHEEAAAAGEDTCLCPACQAGKALLGMKDEILA